MRSRASLLAIALAAIALSPGASARALTLHPIGTFEQPTFVTSEPNPDRLLVTQRFGEIKLVANGQTSTFVDLSSLIGCVPPECAGERGLMSIAVAPDFADSGHVYVDYINNTSGQIHVDELTADGDVAPLSSLRPLLTIVHSDASNHNGGQLQFGPEGDLYISTGDGGGSNDEFHHSQDLGSLLGKLLRIDPQPDGSDPYTVPAGNPFSTSAAPGDTIWSYGLRNPFRFSFDFTTGNLVIGDVGQGTREEVDFAPQDEGGGAGANWGWNCREGFVAGTATDLPTGQCAAASFAEPVFDYPHNDPGGDVAHGCAIIGGYVVRDPSLGAALYGRYLYGDLCVGELRSLALPQAGQGRATGDRSQGLTVENLNSFGEDSCGRLYTVAGSGEVARLEGAAPATCPPTGEPPAEEPPLEHGPGTQPKPVPPASTVVKLHGPRRVAAGQRALLSATVGPCPGRAGERVQLNRGGKPLTSAPLDSGCVARFRARVSRRSTFRASTPESPAYLASRSGKVTISTAPSG